MNNKERSILLAIVCFIGLGACILSYKHGPIAIPFAQQQQTAPPGWMPPTAPVAPGVVPQQQTPPFTQPQQQPQQPQQFAPRRNCNPGG